MSPWNSRKSILPPGWEAAQQLLGTARAFRERVSRFIPLVTWHSEEQTLLIAVDHSSGGLVPAIGAMLDELTRRHGAPIWLAVAMDAYGRVTDAKKEPAIEPDDLAGRFGEGDPQVVEQMLLLVAHDGDYDVWRQVYRFTPVDGWEWDDPQYLVRPELPDNGLVELLVERSNAA